MVYFLAYQIPKWSCFAEMSVYATVIFLAPYSAAQQFVYFQRPVTHPYGAPAIPSCSQRAGVAHTLPANRQMLNLLLLQDFQKPAL